ncbi:MAG TPA: hypothetical protein VFY13_03195 [Luteolibacter sp.]|nr:hypothetical protein [Luteolibacter sp.]
MNENPYASHMPAGDGDPNREQAKAKVIGPAIGLLASASIGILWQILNVVSNLLGAGMGAASLLGEQTADQGLGAMMSGVMGIVFGVIGIIVGGVVIYGAIKMMKLENHGLAMTAAVVAMVPCISPCCILGLPFGIWALTALNDANVKAAFGK